MLKRIERPARMFMIAALTATVACGDDDGPTDPGPPIDLTSGVPVTGIAGGLDSQKLYRIAVPAGATLLEVTTTGGSGDADIYVRFAATPIPDSNDNDCESIQFDTNVELCEIDAPAEGEWFIILYGFEPYSGVTLTATVTTP